MRAQTHSYQNNTGEKIFHNTKPPLKETWKWNRMFLNMLQASQASSLCVMFANVNKLQVCRVKGVRLSDTEDILTHKLHHL